MKKEDLKNKKVAVLGIGIEGYALVEFLKREGVDISILDERNEEKYDKEELEKIKSLGVPVMYGQAFSNLEKYQIIFRSPGVKKNQKALVEAEEKGSIVTSQTQLFFDLCPCPIIGVTGTKGKGTTSSLIYEMLKKQGFDAYLGGNIGTPPISFLDKLSSESRVVLEMSSFQLQDLHTSPHISVMLMTTSEHLDYHKDVYEYIDAKRNIFRFQNKNDYAIVNRDYPASSESDIHTEAKVYRVSREQEVDQGCFVKNDEIYIKMSGREEKVIDAADILLPGRHNLENVCAAVAAAIFGGAQMKAIVLVLKTFKGLEHRLEFVKVANGVKYYDDSFSTTPETAIAAIEAFSEPEILLMGGASKNSDFTELGKVISKTKNIKAIIQIGKEWEKIKEKVSEKNLRAIEDCQTMKEAVDKAAELAELGDVVILSPACSSFDRFKNYKDRGNQFKEAVNKL
jgi:UDP-N-acetylmuramoylalanine--D-glutamate ligase